MQIEIFFSSGHKGRKIIGNKQLTIDNFRVAHLNSYLLKPIE